MYYFSFAKTDHDTSRVLTTRFSVEIYVNVINEFDMYIVTNFSLTQPKR